MWMEKVSEMEGRFLDDIVLHQPQGAARTSGTAPVRSSVLAEVYSALGASDCSGTPPHPWCLNVVFGCGTCGIVFSKGAVRLR